MRCEQEVAGGRDVYVVAAAGGRDRQGGLNLPRYPSVPGRLRAKRKPLATLTPAPPSPASRWCALELPPGSGKQAQVLGNGAEAAPAVVEVLSELGVLMSVLVFVEAPGDELSLQALAFAQGLGDEVHAVLFGDVVHTEVSAGLGIYGATRAYVAEDLRRYAPAAWAQAVCELAERLSPRAIVGPGTDRGNEVLAHVAAMLDQPLAANCTSVDAGRPRSRDAGALGRQPARGGAACTARRCC